MMSLPAILPTGSPKSPPTDGQLGIYAHIPFCIRKCLYCDFNSYPLDQSLAERYILALLTDIPKARERACAGRRASTLYVGGGTPTAVPAANLARVVSACADAFGLDGRVEVTVECNPGTTGRQDIRHLREAGVNRLSIGVQALDDVLLEGLGRIHTAADALAAVRHARLAGIENINLDLMFGIPGQTIRHWRATLERAVRLEPEHISVYPLELEEETPLHRLVSAGEARLPPEDEVLDMWDTAMETLTAWGYSRYEISNYSRPGYESRHNLIYWRNGEYLGLGAGACSHIARERRYNVRSPVEFCRRIEEGSSPVAETIPAAEVPRDVALAIEMSETAMMGLRLADGLSLQEFRARFRKDLDEVFPGVVDRLAALGLVSKSTGSIRLTRRGLFLGNAVFREFVPQAIS